MTSRSSATLQSWDLNVNKGLLHLSMGLFLSCGWVTPSSSLSPYCFRFFFDKPMIHQISSKKTLKHDPNIPRKSPSLHGHRMSSPGDADDNTVGVRAINGDAQEPLAAAAQGSCEDGPLKAESRAPQSQGSYRFSVSKVFKKHLGISLGTSL